MSLEIVIAKLPFLFLNLSIVLASRRDQRILILKLKLRRFSSLLISAAPALRGAPSIMKLIMQQKQVHIFTVNHSLCG